MKKSEEFVEKAWIVNEEAWGLNLSGLFTLLIKEAGRICDDYASDLLYDIDEMKADLKNRDAFAKSKRYSNAGGVERLTYLLGFRDKGVDHKEWVESGEQAYVEILRVTFELDRGFVKVTAERAGGFAD